MKKLQSYQSKTDSNNDDDDDDYGQFCDLEDYSTNTSTKRHGSPTLETIPETKEIYGTFNNLHDDTLDTNYNHTLINGIENILNAKQYIPNTLFATPEKKRQFVQHLICSSVVCVLVIITWK
jgi:hypothetical protein